MAKTFKPFALPPRAAFPGKVVDLSQAVSQIPAASIERIDRSHMGDRRIIIPGEARYDTAPTRPQLHKVCLRPKEQRIGPWAFWPRQLVGECLIAIKPDGSIEFVGEQKLLTQRAPIGTRLGWYAVAWIWHLRLLWSYVQEKRKGKAA